VEGWVRSQKNPLLLKEGWREAPGWFLFFKATTSLRSASPLKGGDFLHFPIRSSGFQSRNNACFQNPWFLFTGLVYDRSKTVIASCCALSRLRFADRPYNVQFEIFRI
jgi:hypothetical protein